MPPGVSAVATDPKGSFVFEALERRADGKPLGSLAVAPFSAALVIDRDGVLQEIVAASAEQALSPPVEGRLVSLGAVELPGGASGFRADLILSRDAEGAPSALSFLALGPPDLGASVALLVRIHALTADWPAGAAMLDSLKILV